MSKDLEEQLKEMGSEYAAVVNRLRNAYDGSALALPHLEERRGRITGWTVGYLVAASLLVFLGLSIMFRNENAKDKIYTVRASQAATEYALAYIGNDKAIDEIVRTQNTDGSWKTDFLTRQNAAVLASCKHPAAQLAYRKAMRNLRFRGQL